MTRHRIILGLFPLLAFAQQPAPDTITLQDALKRAKANSPLLQAALTDHALAREDRAQAKAALLPGVSFWDQFIYTQGNGTPSGRFVANDGVHVYTTQGLVHETLARSQFAEYRRTAAAIAVAAAKAQIAARGLVVTVIQSYYALVISQRKYSTAEKAADEARRFLTISQQLERGGEIPRSDVIKAQLQYQDRQRDLREASLAIERDRLNLALLLYSDFNESFTVVDELRLPPPLPAMDEIAQQARQNNPDLSAALAAVEEASLGERVARGAYYPTVALDYFYGINANQFALESDHVKRLGSAAQVSLSVPVWNWGALRSKVKQSGLRHEQAKRELTFVQRRLVGNLRALYAEAQAARSELDLARTSADLAAESLRLNTLRYKSGEASVLEVVDAQTALTAARNAFDDGEARYGLALAGLQVLTGAL